MALKKYTKELSRRHTILSLLEESYPNATCALTHNSTYQLTVATILSAQCTDVMVNKVTPMLFQVAPTPNKMNLLTLTELQDLIRPTGFYVNKAKHIKQMTKQLIEEYDGVVPATMEQLIRLSGIGRKTASVVLGTAFGKSEGIVVDTHVKRLSQRLKLTQENKSDKIERELMSWVPRTSWISLSHCLILHGRQICQARKPNCSHCFLVNYCPSSDNFV